MKLFLKKPDEAGQGLVEYALILVLVSIVVIGILLVLGPTVSEVYCRVSNTLEGGSCGALVSVSAARTGNDHGNDVEVTIVVDQSTTLTVTDSQSGTSKSTSCTDTCNMTFTGVGDAAGTITAKDDLGGVLSASYSHKK